MVSTTGPLPWLKGSGGPAPLGSMVSVSPANGGNMPPLKFANSSQSTVQLSIGWAKTARMRSAVMAELWLLTMPSLMTRRISIGAGGYPPWG